MFVDLKGKHDALGVSVAIVGRRRALNGEPAITTGPYWLEDCCNDKGGNCNGERGVVRNVVRTCGIPGGFVSTFRNVDRNRFLELQCPEGLHVLGAGSGGLQGTGYGGQDGPSKISESFLDDVFDFGGDTAIPRHPTGVCMLGAGRAGLHGPTDGSSNTF